LSRRFELVPTSVAMLGSGHPLAGVKMKIIKQEKTGNKVKMQVELASALLKQALDKTYEEIVSEAKIPGFRKGKAPRKLIESRMEKASVLNRAINNLISDSYPKIIEEAKIEPVDFPEVTVLSGDVGKPLVFEVSVDVYPEVKLGKYKRLTVEVEKRGVSDKEIDNFINSLRERFASYIDISERGTENEDFIHLDIAATSGAGDVKSLSGKGVNLVVGRGHVTKEFDKELLGLKVGENKDFKIVMPEDYPVKDVAGKEITFAVNVKSLRKKQLPPLDEEFTRKTSGKESIEEFKQDVRERLEKIKNERVDSEIRDKLVAEVSSKMKVDIPPGMVRRETDLMIDELKGSLAQDKLSLDDYLRSTKKDIEALRQELKKGAEVRVKGKIALRAVAEAEKIEVAPENLEEELKQLAKGGGNSLKEFKEKIGEGGIGFVKDYLLRRRALDFLVSKAKIRNRG